MVVIGLATVAIAAVTAVALAYCEIYVFGVYDLKYRDARDLAFEFEAAGWALLFAPAVLVGLLCLRRLEARIGERAARILLASSAVGATALYALGRVG